MKPKSFLYSEADGVATVTLNRPEKLNALTFETYAELRDTLAWLGGRSEVRSVVITGAGRGFCSGGDVHEIIGELVSMDEQKLLDFARMTCDVVRNVRSLLKPVVAAVNGTAVGAGAAIALACDVRIASDEAKFAFLFTKVGLSGADMGACFLLPRVIGFGRASEILLTGDTISSEKAHAIGLVNHVFPRARVLSEAQALARRLAQGPADGLAVTKEMLNRELFMSLDEALDAEARAQAGCLKHPDFREAYEAFLEKRPARFRGAS